MWNIYSDDVLLAWEMIPGSSIISPQLLFLVTTTVICLWWFLSQVLLNTGKVLFEWCKQVTDDRYTPRPSQKPLPGQPTHVGHVCVMDREAKHPLHLSAPENVLLLVHEDREMLVFTLLNGIRASGDGPHFAKLRCSAMLQTLLKVQSVSAHGSQGSVHARQVPPEVAGAVSSRHLLGIDHHRVTL